MSEWNRFNKINKTRKLHYCECTGEEIPIGSSCWQFVGHWDGEFQGWYMSDEAKDFFENNKESLCDWDGFTCEGIGEAMREAKKRILQQSKSNHPEH